MPETFDDIERLRQELEDERARLAHQLRVATDLVNHAKQRLDGALLGSSKAVLALREHVESAAADHLPVLIEGPVGAGHEAVARAVHDASARSHAPFIFVDCLGLVRQDKRALFGSGGGLAELFRDETPGKWGLAYGGTLYFHRADCLHAALAKELGKRLSRARSSQATDKGENDVRVIASVVGTAGSPIPGEADALGHLVELTSGRRITAPGLSERRADIDVLVEHFARVRSQQLGRTVDGVERQTLRQLRNYSWPGNIEELESIVDCAVLASRGGPLVVDRTLLESGNRVGQYELLEQLGAGAMGEVWAARHRLLARPAAIKLVRVDATRDEEAVQRRRRRFEREARATAALESPNTVELYDFGAAPDGRFFYVMERLRGMDLESMVEEFGPLPEERVVWLLAQACGSLAEAHDKGLIHRDIKPANLFASVRGHDHDVLKVLDFGIVRMKVSGETNLTGNSMLGTPAYMAPEAALIDGLDGRADLYSLGCVAFWLLTGRLVFEGETPMAQIMARTTRAAPRVSSIADAPVSEALDELIADLLAMKPEDRPPSASAVRDRLDELPLKTPWSRKQAAAWWAGVGSPAGVTEGSSSTE